jgi:predicted Fe-Mo cluster-binding NifX family protein
MEKIAAVTDDGNTISAHFGRATKYVVLTIDDGQVVSREVREKAGHHDFQHDGSHDRTHHEHGSGRGTGKHSARKHQRMFETIPDCEIVLARGMGQGAHQGLVERGIRPILTDIANIDEAVEAVINGSIEDNLARLH